MSIHEANQQAMWIGAKAVSRMVTITYTPNGGAAREISAIVVYDNDHASSEGGSRFRTPQLLIMVDNSASTGIAMTELDLGVDTVTLEPRQGETERDFKITAIRKQNIARLVLEVR